MIAWDEEGLFEFDYERYNDVRVDPIALQMCEKFFAWGPMQAASVRLRNSASAHKVVETGNPRFDALRPEFRQIFSDQGVDFQSYGDVILINSSFASCNPFNGDINSTVNDLIRLGNRPETERDYYRERIGFQERIFKQFIKLVPILAGQFPLANIVIRPHPSENHQAWVTASAGLPNVHVLYEGTANAWSSMAKVIIHHSCTTGFEAMLMGKNVVAFCPEPADGEIMGLANSGSVKAENFSSLLQHISDILEGKSVASGREPPDLSFFISGTGESAASDLILDALDQMPVMAPVTSFARDLRFLTRIAKNRVRQSRGYKLLRPPISSTGSSVAYKKHKNPGTSLEEIEDIARSASVRGRFVNVKIYSISSDAFLVTS